MKVRYDIHGSDATGCFWTKDQREAFEVAKQVAKGDKFGYAYMRRLLWDDAGRITINTVAVHADGSYTKIN